MKKIFSLLLVALLISNITANDLEIVSNNRSDLSSATINVITKICGAEMKLSKLLFHPKHRVNFTFMDVVNGILHASSREQKISFRVMTTHEARISQRAQCIVIITTSCDEFKAYFSDAFIAHLNNEHSPLLIVLLNTTDDDSYKVMSVFDYLWNASVYNVNMLTKNTDVNGISVLTYFPFQGHHCSDTTPTLINEFYNGKFINSTANFFPTKMSDLQMCSIRVATSNNSQPYIFTKKLQNSSLELYGREITFLNALAESLRFKVDYVYIGKEGVLLENGTAEGIYKKLVDATADMAIADMWLKSNRLKFIDATSSYINQQIAFVIPPGLELTSFEKYLRPMDAWTWIISMITIALAFIVIFVVKRKPIHVQNFVFGDRVRDPYLNVLVGLFGGSQTVLPLQNFARFLLMMYLIFCLIMRSLYQGSLYRFLQTKIYHKEVQSIDEMILRDYRFYVVPSILDLIEGHQRINERRVVMTIEQRQTLFSRSNDPTFKGAFFRSLTGVLYENQHNFNGTRYLICKEIFLTIPVVIYVRKGFFLLQPLNERIAMLEAGGLINYWHSQIIDERYLKVIESQDPSAIQLHHLSGGFFLLLFGCVASSLAFICEVLHAKYFHCKLKVQQVHK